MPKSLARALTRFALVGTLAACQPPAQDTADTASSPPPNTASSETDSATPRTQAQDAPAVRSERKLWQRQPASSSAFATLTVPSEDGKPAPLAIESVAVSVEVRGRMARTEVTQIFRNHLPRQSEGTYAFTLPEGAAISRLAMDVEGKMMEGELVERDKARKIYEQIVRGQKDPALLEWSGGNRFTTQIFPIPAGGTKTVVLSYDELLPERDGEAWYRYNLPILKGDAQGSNVAQFRFSLRSDTTQPMSVSGYPAKIDQDGELSLVSVSAQSFVPNGPLEVFFTRASEATRLQYSTRTDQTFFYADLIPQLPEAAVDTQRDLVIALDTSAGLGATELDRAKQSLTTLLATLPPERAVHIVHGDFTIQTCPALTAGDTAGLNACIGALQAGGATHLSGLLGRAAEVATALGKPAQILLLSDGVASLGELDGDLIRSTFLKAIGNHDITLHTVATGHSPDEAYLAGLARATNGHALRLTPADDPAWFGPLLAERLHQPLLTDITVEVVEGTVQDLFPNQATSAAPGESLGIFGRIESPTARIRVKGRYLGQDFNQEIALAPPPGPLEHPMLANFWARSHIASLEQGRVDRDAVVKASMRYGVMSQYTSFLVLENDEAYKRFQIDRKKDRERKAEEATRKGPQALTKSDQDLSKLLADKPSADPPPPPAEAKPEPMVAKEAEATADDEAPRSARPMKQESRKKDAKSKRRRPNWNGRIKSLEARIGSLTQDEQAQLLDLYARVGDAKKAQAFYDTLAKQAQDPANLAPLFNSSRVRVLLPEAWLTVLEAQLKAKPDDLELLEALWTHFIQMGRHDEVVSRFAERALPTPRRQALLIALVQATQADKAKQLLQLWTTRFQLTATDIDTLLSNPQLATPFANEVFAALTTRHSEGQSLDTAQMQRFVDAGLHSEQRGPVLDLLEAQCGSGRFPLESCRTWLVPFGTDPRATAILDKLVEARLSQMKAVRSDDIGNPELILEFAGLLEDKGRRDEAQRLLSELVEFAPQDYGMRKTYAQALVTREQVKEGCEQYASAVQLNPAERDTFRTMMDLRRSNEQFAKPLRSCVVDGVSKLPVQRDISLVLTWEDNSADIDLHIHEAGGEEVYYSHRESEAGGLLYYDITNGYGPEIYVLGSAPKGDYRLTVVYYSGSAEKIAGTLTVLRNAGAPDEVREDIPFTLEKSRGKTPLDLTSLKL